MGGIRCYKCGHIRKWDTDESTDEPTHGGEWVYVGTCYGCDDPKHVEAHGPVVSPDSVPTERIYDLPTRTRVGSPDPMRGTEGSATRPTSRQVLHSHRPREG